MNRAVQALAKALTVNKTLTHLDISNVGLTVDAITSVMAALSYNNSTLRELNMRENGLTKGTMSRISKR